MTWIKICGITNLEDALVAVEAGADALGFVFYEMSPRNMREEETRRIVEQLPKAVEKVGVFSGHPDSVGLARRCGFDAMQTCIRRGALSGFPQSSTPEKRSSFKHYWSLPFSTFSDEGIGRGNLASVATGHAFWSLFDACFIDSGSPEQPGGTGQRFDWIAAVPIFELLNRRTRVVLAGGLTSENVTEAMHILHPWGVDVSSGVEAKPGKKDPEKVRAFIRAVREADRVSSN